LAQPPLPKKFNYITKGYATQVADGLDMKKGYHFHDVFDVRRGNYEFTAKELIRESSDQLAGVLVIAKSLTWNKTYYLCIPHDNNALVEKYWNDIGQWDREMSIMYSQVFSESFGATLAVIHEDNKKIRNCR
jgi:hypothetical protein